MRVPRNEVIRSCSQLISVSLAVIRAQVPGTVAEADRERFVALVMEEFQNLHSGNVIRFGLRPLEFAAWQEKNSGKN